MINIPLKLTPFKFLKLGKITWNADKTKKIIKGFEDDWQNKGYTIEEMQSHLAADGQYGVIGSDNYFMIDIDKKGEDFEEVVEASAKLPQTFTVATVSGGLHLYYKSTEKQERKVLKKEAGEIRATGMMVIGAGCKVDDKQYAVIKDIAIAEVSPEKIKETFKKWWDKEVIKKTSDAPAQTDKTRSGKEWGLVCKMIERGLSKESVFKKMKLYAKWSESPEQYREHQYTQALKHIKEKKAEKIEQIVEKYDLASLSFDVVTKIALKKRSEATEKIVQKVLEEEHIYTTRDDEKAEMWIYKDGIYIPQAKTFLKEISRRIFGEVYTTSLGNEVIAKIEAETYIDQDEFFTNEDIEEIAVENGILNIFTKELMPFTSEKRFFNKLPVAFDPDAVSEAIPKHFKTVLKYEEDLPVIKELFGYLLLRDYKIEKAFMLIGNGRNGKSKTLELMKRFIGIDNCSSIPLQQLEDDNFAMGELFNKMANIAGDLDKKALKNTGAFKTLTGRDLISAARKFLTRVKFVNHAKLIFACNNLPVTYDLSTAFFSRWLVLEFPYTFVPKEEYDKIEKAIEKAWHKIQDPDIIEKIGTPEELSGWLNVVLDALNDLIKRGDFSYSKNTEEVKQIWLRKSSSFQAFLMDHLIEDYDNNMYKSELRQRYAEYCRKHRLTPQTDKAIKFVLETTFGAWEKRITIEREQHHVWSGINFKENRGNQQKL